MSREEMLLESIRNYFHLKKENLSFDVILKNGRLIEKK